MIVERTAAKVAETLSVVERVLQNLAGLEGEDASGRDGDAVSRLRVTPHPLLLRSNHEVAEPADLQLFAVAQRVLHRLEDLLYDVSGFLFGEHAELLVDVLDDVRLRHRPFFFFSTHGCVALEIRGFGKRELARARERPGADLTYAAAFARVTTAAKSAG